MHINIITSYHYTSMYSNALTITFLGSQDVANDDIPLALNLGLDLPAEGRFFGQMGYEGVVFQWLDGDL